MMAPARIEMRWGRWEEMGGWGLVCSATRVVDLGVASADGEQESASERPLVDEEEEKEISGRASSSSATDLQRKVLTLWYVEGRTRDE